MNKDLDYTMKFEGISDDKMSVSQALDFVNEALLEKGYNPIVYRYFCLLSHYRKSLVFDWDNLNNAVTSYNKIIEKIITKIIHFPL